MLDCYFIQQGKSTFVAYHKRHRRVVALYQFIDIQRLTLNEHTVVVEVEKGFTDREQQIADEVSNEIRQEYSCINDMVERGDCRYCDIVLSYMATAVERVRARMHQVCMQDEVEPQAHKFMAIWNNVNEVEYNKLYARVRKLPYTPDALKEGELSQAEYDSLQLLIRQKKDEMMLLITQ